MARTKKVTEEQARFAAQLKEREDFIKAIETYKKNISTVENYYKLMGMTDHLAGYPESLKMEERLEFLHREEPLKELQFNYPKNDINYRIWSFIWDLLTTNEMYENPREVHTQLNRPLRLTDFYLNDIIWDYKQMLMYIINMQKFGYENLVYTGESTAVMQTLTWLQYWGGKIIGTNGKRDYKGNITEDCGLIINISEIDPTAVEALMSAKGNKEVD